MISSFGSTHLKVGGDGRVTPPPLFLLFNVPFPLTHEPLKVNIKCILPVAFLVFSLLQSIFFYRRIRKPFPPRSFFMIHTLFVSSFQKHSSHLCFILQKLSRRSRWMCFFFFLSKQVDFSWSAPHALKNWFKCCFFRFLSNCISLSPHCPAAYSSTLPGLFFLLQPIHKQLVVLIGERAGGRQRIKVFSRHRLYQVLHNSFSFILSVAIDCPTSSPSFSLFYLLPSLLPSSPSSLLSLLLNEHAHTFHFTYFRSALTLSQVDRCWSPRISSAIVLESLFALLLLRLLLPPL